MVTLVPTAKVPLLGVSCGVPVAIPNAAPHRIAGVCARVQPLGFLRIPHSRLRRVLGSAAKSSTV